MISIQLFPFRLLLLAGLAIDLSQAADTAIPLTRAIALALEKNPALAAFDADLRLAEAKVISALAVPNPELEMEAEDIFGSGDYDGVRGATYNAGFRQILELGRKRHLRGEVAKAGQTAEQLRFEATRNEVLQETALRFVAALTAQARESNAAANLQTAEDAFTNVRQLQEGGRGSDLNVGQAELERKGSRLTLQTAQRETILAHRRLAAMWAQSTPDFTRAAGRLEPPANPLPSEDELRSRLEAHPRMALAAAGVAVAEQELALQRKMVVPDLTVGVAYRRDSSVDDNAMVIGFSLPLPLWNQNQGGIREAAAGVDQNESRIRQTRSSLDLALSDAVARLAAADAEYRLVASDLLTGAEEQNNKMAEAYRLGRITYLELLEARRALATVRGQRIDALSNYHAARIEIESLAGPSW